MDSDSEELEGIEDPIDDYAIVQLFFVYVCFTDIRSRVSYRTCGHVIGISLTTITHSIIFPFTELNSSRPRLVAALV